ncbi:TPA: crossover junction endodeoxyribonuclease RuvC [Patescibacteria group bacterium]|uniref:Crossover junction endodeoxyribonuclease RuvC n=1 Tax=Candidatus Gottesmanbacteria bacterium GW2011_GWA1_43_11 TaxID=1618436 RepID=A0A0G1CID5_9BACT|nr:MAG: Crossover junction endodeoxyribonuclease RuvC [Candidatus Gottesmanbacteria bacterium GW2011_GWA1_43_11]HCS79464.1 crossover junction endodeoxyribonuclease RuvC [Patescibacteria group bacterium]
MIIMGIDPGIAITGWGVIRAQNRQPSCVDVGVITTDKADALEERLAILFTDMNQLLKRYRPDVVVLEQLFFNTNAKTALTVGHARGVIMLAARQFGSRLFAYTPLQVKVAITGYGRADKNQIQQMVTKLLKLDQIPQPDDAADALAIALTHGFSTRLG